MRPRSPGPRTPVPSPRFTDTHIALGYKSVFTGLSHASFKLPRNTSLLAQIEHVKLLIIKLRGNKKEGSVVS